MKSSRRELRNFVQGGVYDPAQPGLTTRNYSYQNTQKKGATAAASDNQSAVKHEEPTKGVQQDASFSAISENGEAGTPGKKGKIPFKKIFANRKKASVRAKEKKVRQNRQLRKVILPKNALMALSEVRGINMSDFTINNDVGGGFTATVSVNDIQYEGKGTSKMLAKNNACEKALRDYVLTKMRQKPRKKGSGDNTMDTSEGNDAESLPDDHPYTDDGDDVPMINLASFALFKLFTEWENEGFEIPEFHPTNRHASSTEGEPVTPKEPKKPIIRNDLPPNWDTMHPATLLCVMRPGAIYSDYGLSGEKPNVVQSLGVVVDGKEYIGKGRSKKTARRNVAAIICNALFGTHFELEDVIANDTPTAMVS